MPPTIYEERVRAWKRGNWEHIHWYQSYGLFGLDVPTQTFGNYFRRRLFTTHTAAKTLLDRYNRRFRKGE